MLIWLSWEKHIRSSTFFYFLVRFLRLYSFLGCCYPQKSFPLCFHFSLVWEKQLIVMSSCPTHPLLRPLLNGGCPSYSLTFRMSPEGLGGKQTGFVLDCLLESRMVLQMIRAHATPQELNLENVRKPKSWDGALPLEPWDLYFRLDCIWHLVAVI